MLDLHTLALFSLASLALTATPGPDMLLIASRSVAQGRSVGFVTLMGIQAGTYCHALAAAFGPSNLFLLVPVAYDAVRFAGAAHLLLSSKVDEITLPGRTSTQQVSITPPWMMTNCGRVPTYRATRQRP
ncbi:hypothetical protein SSBR45G_55660 [Bradyrhizobium sp. SSBR45G]|nr:hypothetical protein SSBR45G_55660 [Bradyrhizobium sp. SSBR45G]GLH85863.1 hypothetical protein SSBR45R_33230 [Bradyrhizobium sp. SSBR45R]